MTREIYNLVLSRPPKLCNFIEWKNYKIVYRRYASLYFIMCVDQDDNELIALETIHHFVEVLDRYFGNVYVHLIDFSKIPFVLSRLTSVVCSCELDIIFSYYKAYFILDECFLNGSCSLQLGGVVCLPHFPKCAYMLVMFTPCRRACGNIKEESIAYNQLAGWHAGPYSMCSLLRGWVAISDGRCQTFQDGPTETGAPPKEW
jgi:hypothetical protein